MGVSDEADAVILGVEAELGEERGEDVLPQRVTGACVVETDGRLLPLGVESFQEGEVLRGDDLLRPLGCDGRSAGELVQRDLSGDGEVMVTGEAYGGVLAGELHAGVGLG